MTGRKQHIGGACSQCDTPQIFSPCHVIKQCQIDFPGIELAQQI